MPGTLPGLTPRHVFEDNLRPAELLLKVYNLLACDTTHTEHEILNTVRGCLGANTNEGLLLLYNQLFVGIVRERAQLSPNTFKRAMLDNLLRQSVAAACTALDAFLPSLLRSNIAMVLKAKGSSFLPSDKETRGFFQGITFSLEEAARLLTDSDPALFITNRILLAIKDKGAGNATAVHAIGSLLGLDDPWKMIGERLTLSGDKLKQLLNDTTSRRNDIIHRADRSKTNPDGDMQDISYAWTKQAVDNISNVCFALDELVTAQMHVFAATTSAP